MAKLLNNNSINQRFIFDKYYMLKFASSRSLQQTQNWYIIPKDAKLEGL